ncbi:conserved hypothetical protein [Leishmania major strain Friedlin]|uniref:Uncharacterized protein n=1 Tax=Leishmania major TaxID=5664 RepID=Q4QE18_LEIMA|nr:conserved hypothetical protein [Leishmania major strain Friedlin]CAG9572407.1 hypothetical_protein_-_conserved [Leishmania major strain Friedlin]CAJ03492.1 conserved hypothetical protein [Leishmania major strain Friedlin]|eukprot:XP_001682430.1 conserved hypothetical protein [Leishmania major strain Friedlin]
MVPARHIIHYFADRHTAAVATAFFIYVLIIGWCGNTGTREVQQRTEAVFRRLHSTADASSSAGSSFFTSSVAHSVSVAVLRLTDADAELLHGGTLDRVPSWAEREQQLLSLASRWQYYFTVGDFTLISAPSRLTASGMLKEWIATLGSVYPTCVFASLAGGAGSEDTEDDRQVLILPSAWQSHRRALMGDRHQQSLRVLRVHTLPAPERLRERAAAVAAASNEGNDGAKDPLFVFVSENATRTWSAAVDAAERKRLATERWRSGKSGLDAWEELLQTTSMSQAALRAAVGSAAALPSVDDFLPPDPRRRVAQLRGKTTRAPSTSVMDAAQYIPRLAMDLANTYRAPYVILASWCSSAGTYGWNGTSPSGAGTEDEGLVLVLCLQDNELVDIVPSRQHVSRLLQQ